MTTSLIRPPDTVGSAFCAAAFFGISCLATTPQRRIQRRVVDGVLFLDKPVGLTSNHALQKARRLLNAAKAGHTGTLDPMASGLLPLTFGEATKFSQTLLDADKGYDATVLLGVTTTTADAEGEVLARSEVHVSDAEIEAAMARLRGGIEQVPPMYSALKHHGKALYEYARAGVEIPREPRKVTIHRFECLGRDGDSVYVRVRCSKGTYVRTLASDLGAMLGCGAHLTALRRTHIGPFALNVATPLADFEALSLEERDARLAPVDALLEHLAVQMLDETRMRSFTHGQSVKVEEGAEGALFRVYHDERFLGVGTLTEGGVLVPTRLMSTGTQ